MFTSIYSISTSCLSETPGYSLTSSKIEPVTAGSVETCLCFHIFSLETRYIVYRFTCSNHDRLGFFAEIQGIFGTVCCFCWTMYVLWVCMYVCILYTIWSPGWLLKVFWLWIPFRGYVREIIIFPEITKFVKLDVCSSRIDMFPPYTFFTEYISLMLAKVMTKNCYDSVMSLTQQSQHDLNFKLLTFLQKLFTHILYI